MSRLTSVFAVAVALLLASPALAPTAIAGGNGATTVRVDTCVETSGFTICYDGAYVIQSVYTPPGGYNFTYNSLSYCVTTTLTSTGELLDRMCNTHLHVKIYTRDDESQVLHATVVLSVTDSTGSTLCSDLQLHTARGEVQYERLTVAPC
jgi:hypothetical protein